MKRSEPAAPKVVVGEDAPAFDCWEDEARYWRARAVAAEVELRAHSSLSYIRTAGEDRDFWAGRARRAEVQLRVISRLVVRMEDVLLGLSDGDGKDDDGKEG